MRLHTSIPAAVLLALTFAGSARADVVSESRALIDAGNYDEAITLARGELEARPKSNMAGTLNALVGEALYLSGDSDEASVYLEKARARGVANAFLFGGRIAMEAYDFPAAAKMYGRYVELKEKASKPVDEEALHEKEAVELASDMIERVEDITVIDRIDVNSEDFFNSYRLSAESGRILDADAVSADYPGLSAEIQAPVFENERADFRLWAQPDSADDGRLHIVESNRYIDGGWETPQPADEVLNGGGDAAFPFMMADGTTLYFASNGEGSIGGYDIFRSNRDSSTAQYKAPSNMGMPYNSPYNDYMLAIDESTGVGWWATDRNNLPDGKISIYLFIPNEMRRNHDAENPDIISLARLDDISITQDDADSGKIESLRQAVARIEPADTTPQTVSGSFCFPVAAGKVYHNLGDFRSDRAATLMGQWLERSDDFIKMRQQLSDLRKKVADGESGNATRRQILELENRCEKERAALNRLRGEIIRAESKNSD